MPLQRFAAGWPAPSHASLQPRRKHVSFNSFASTMQRALLLYFSAACATADASMVHDVYFTHQTWVLDNTFLPRNETRTTRHIFQGST